MHQAASTRVYFLISSLLSLAAFGCSGGDDSGSNPGPVGPAGGSGGAPATAGTLIATCEMGSAADPNVHDGYFADPAKGWELAWFTYTDMTAGTITPAEKAGFVCVSDMRAGAPSWVFNAKGGNFTMWGAGMGFNMKIMEPPGNVDLSAYKGVRFWAKVNDPVTSTVRLKLVDAQSTPPERGGTCSGANGACDNSFGFVLSTISLDWQQFSVDFSQMTQESWSSEKFTAAQTTNVIGFQFQIGKVATFDYSIDDFELY
jgi:hypothetical protein